MLGQSKNRISQSQQQCNVSLIFLQSASHSADVKQSLVLLFTVLNLWFESHSEYLQYTSHFLCFHPMCIGWQQCFVTVLRAAGKSSVAVNRGRAEHSTMSSRCLLLYYWANVSIKVLTIVSLIIVQLFPCLNPIYVSYWDTQWDISS